MWSQTNNNDFSSDISDCPLKNAHDDYKTLKGFNIFRPNGTSTDINITYEIGDKPTNSLGQCIILYGPEFRNGGQLVYMGKGSPIKTKVCIYFWVFIVFFINLMKLF